MANVTLSPEVTDVLSRSTIEGNSLKLPGQLDRKSYEAVNKVIVLCGGKWNRSAGVHLFPGDARSKLGLALETGVAVDVKKQLQAFYTPPDLARRVVEMARVYRTTVLEPSVGEGALAYECLAQGARKVTGIEIDPETFAKVKARGGISCLLDDFLKVEPPPDYALFDRVVMNPPFTKNQDIKHVQHALKFLKRGGVLVSIMAGNIGREQFKKFIDGLDCEVEDAPQGSFKESGTGIETVIVTIRN